MVGAAPPKLILIVDNSSPIRKIVREFLESASESCVCIEAVDGAEAIQKIQEVSPDLIILNVSLPHLNGIETSRISKKKRPQTPIILFTLFHDALKSFDTSAAGIDAVIPETADISVLGGRIQELFQEAR
jgi:DNA-binding NarL/FixJ family response regulator